MPRTLQPEDRISHYRIIGPLGAGGMGEVYRAHDETLARDVALKILPPELVASKERIRRFVLEAKSASSLNHPHIVTIHEIGEHQVRRAGDRESDTGPVHFIAMELVNGRTLAAHIHQEKSDLKTLLGWMAQAAEGLAKAHAAGIVHRDLKPANIMVSQDGYAKVLDFGLAKLTDRTAPTGESAASTMTAEHTSEGVVLGTAGYMAPEQVQGKLVDHRADVFAFGCMLYEAATHRPPFAAESKVETMHRILHASPAPIEELNREAPAELRRLVRRCLAKDPHQRLDSMRALALELREIVEEYDTLSASASSGSDVSAASATKRKRSLASVALPIAVMAVVAALSWLVWKRPWRAEPAGGAPPATWKRLTFEGRALWGDLSPDGTTLAYVVADGRNRRLMVQDVSGGDAIAIFEGSYVSQPQWSLDGREILIWGRSVTGSLAMWQVPRMGGTPRAIPARAQARPSPDGRSAVEFAVPWQRFYVVGLATGDTSGIQLQTRFTWLQDVEWSPDGKRFLVVVEDPGRTSLWTMKVDGSDQRKVHEANGRLFAGWAPRGDAIYGVRDAGSHGELVKVHLTRDGAASRRPARVLVSEPALRSEWLSSHLGVSRDGKRLVCTRTEGSANLWLWDRGSRASPRAMTQGTAMVERPLFSPDGRQAAFLSDRGGVKNVHVLDLADGSSRQVTFMEDDVQEVAWSPDGRRVAFTCLDRDTMKVWRVAVRGGRAAPYRRAAVGSVGLAWAPASRLLYQSPDRRNFIVLDPESEAERPLVANDSVGWMFNPVWSPDGKHVALQWNRRGASGLWVVSTDDTVQTRLVANFNYRPQRWNEHGSALLVSGPTGILRVGYPRADTTTAFHLPVDPGLTGMGEDFTPDFQRCVFVAGVKRSDLWLLENFDPDVR
jgi:serine/threonine protein kinase/Tol biopolymer transport system component